jgi:hypothetical protein
MTRTRGADVPRHNLSAIVETVAALVLLAFGLVLIAAMAKEAIECLILP